MLFFSRETWWVMAQSKRPVRLLGKPYNARRKSSSPLAMDGTTGSKGPEVVGSSLVHEEKVIHMAFFEMNEAKKVGRMSSASRRRRYRV